MPHPRIRKRLLLAAALLLLGGCVERTIEIRTDPPGARVYVDGLYRGRTAEPLTDASGAFQRWKAKTLVIPFDHYGTREIVLVHEGYAPRTALEKIRPPLYQIFPLDFIFECLVPFTLRDRNVYSYRLSKLPLPDSSQLARERRGLAARAEKMRKELSREDAPSRQD
jgi:hypothetical protein